jgi:glycosyltransferase involved in cell wall biosynthesis
VNAEQILSIQTFGSGTMPAADATFTNQPTVLPRLTIVIPALNEEESIGSTVQRCLDAQDYICQHGHVRDIEIIVVSDGSTDRTASIAQEIAARESSVRVIVFEKNRGYGAAIKEGFARGSGEFVSFLDADGTCDPRYFGELCRSIHREGAALALGSRMGTGTKMPLVRRIGNSIYALLLGSLSGRAVTDTASGMRVLRRAALTALYPLPDGLHFTPAMSARALMRDQRIVEVPMAYAERVGESKLHVLRDGVRFLFAIRDAVLLFQPLRVFGLTAFIAFVFGILLSAFPVEFYASNHRLEEWMIYRLLLCGLLFTSSFGLVGGGVICSRILSVLHGGGRQTFVGTLLDGFMHRSRLFAVAALSTLGAVVLVWPGLAEFIATQHTTIHWSRPVVAVFLLQIALFSIIYAVIGKVIDLWKGQLEYAIQNERAGNRV